MKAIEDLAMPQPEAAVLTNSPQRRPSIFSTDGDQVAGKAIAIGTNKISPEPK